MRDVVQETRRSRPVLRGAGSWPHNPVAETATVSKMITAVRMNPPDSIVWRATRCRSIAWLTTIKSRQPRCAPALHRRWDIPRPEQIGEESARCPSDTRFQGGEYRTPQL